MDVNHACDDDGGQSNAVRDPLHRLSGRPERGRRNIRARVSVHDDGDDDVENGVEALQHKERFGEVFGLLELADEGEEGRVPEVGEYDVGHAHEGGREFDALDGGLDYGVWSLDADADHGYDAGG